MSTKNMNRIFIDANIFTYFLTNHPRHGETCVEFLEEIEEGKRIGFISPLVIDEVIYVLMIQKMKETTPTRDVTVLKRKMLGDKSIWNECLNPVTAFFRYIDHLTALGNLEILNIEYTTSKIALEISREHFLFPRDALHAACCKAHDITNIATNDRDFERVEWLNVWKP